MKNKDEFKTKDLASEFLNYKSDDSSWWIGLALITGLFDSWGYKGNDKNVDFESRLSKLETKTEILEKILLK